MSSSGTGRAEIAFLVLLTLSAFGARLHHLGTASLAEDEAAKWLAIQQYKQGHFVNVNGEHPMLMKLLAWGSLELGERWNRWAGGHLWLRAREEATVRFPNAVVGAATTIVIYALGKQMLGVVGGGAAAFFWALTPFSVALNRIAKEDTLTAFFTWLAIYLYWRGKKTWQDGPARRLFTWSGMCFGLSAASKYYFHYIGLNFLAWHVAGAEGFDRRPLKPFRARFWLAMGLAFLIANPVILFPSDVGYILGYLGEKTMVHHGYNLHGHLYMNTFSSSPFGLPSYFYIWALAVKMPLPVLGAMAAGVIFLVLRRHTLAGIFLRVMVLYSFVPFSLVGGKWFRYLVTMLPFLFLLAGLAVERLYEWLKRARTVGVRRLGIALVGLAFVCWPAVETFAWAPQYRLYLNQFGGGRGEIGRIFSPDEVYDLGVREAVEYACHIAPPNAVLAVNNPMAVSYYLQKCGRNDIRVAALFDPKYFLRGGDFVLIQDSRRYFETEELFAQVERHGQPLVEVKLAGVVASRLYRF